MTKVDINIDDVNNMCVPCCDSLKKTLQLAKNKFKQVDLPFSCDKLNQTVDDISRIISIVSDFTDELKEAKDFCIKSENVLISDSNKIDNFII